MVLYSLSKIGSDSKWKLSEMLLSGLEGGLQGAASFGIAFLGGKLGLYSSKFLGMKYDEFFIHVFQEFGRVPRNIAIGYAVQFMISTIGSKLLLVTAPTLLAKYIIDKIIYGV